MVKFRHIKPFLPHLNGKAKRTQKTDLEEFYCTVYLGDPNLSMLLEKWHDLCIKNPLSEEVWSNYDPEKEGYRVQNFKVDTRIRFFI